MDHFNLIVATYLLKFQMFVKTQQQCFHCEWTSCCVDELLSVCVFLSSCQYSSVTSLDKDFCVFLN